LQNVALSVGSINYSVRESSSFFGVNVIYDYKSDELTIKLFGVHGHLLF